LQERCAFYDAEDCVLHLRIRELLGVSDPSDTVVLFGADHAVIRTVQVPLPPPPPPPLAQAHTCTRACTRHPSDTHMHADRPNARHRIGPHCA
jgi:hypothetical protein